MILALLILLLTTLAGRKLNQWILPPPTKLADTLITKTPGAMLEIPAAFLTGWLIYCFFGYLIAVATHSTLIGALAGITLCVLLALLPKPNRLRPLPPSSIGWAGTATIIIILIACYLLVFYPLQTNTQGDIQASLNFFSDFSFHFALIRSFSWGANLPAEFPFFPGEGMPYHFLHQLGCATLETLGASFTTAFNLPSAAGLASMLLIFHVLTIRITKKRLAGPLAVILILLAPTFPTAFTIPFLQGDGLKTMLKYDSYPQILHVDDWGLWIASNILVNQRHLAFGLALTFYTLLFALTNLKAMQKHLALTCGLFQKIKYFLFSKEAWFISRRSLLQSLALGILLGMGGIYNGSAVMITLLALATLGIFSANRLSFAIIGITAAGIGIIQNKILCPDLGVGSMSWHPGFLADPPTINDIVKVLWISTGLTLPLLLLAFWLTPTRRQMLPFILAALTPMLFAFLIQASPDMPANHKFVLASALLCLIPTAGLIARLLHTKTLWGIGLLILCLLPAYGYLPTLTRRLQPGPTYSSEKIQQTGDKLPRNAVVLSAPLVNNLPLSAGRKAYAAGPYFSLSSGLDFQARAKDIGETLQTQDPKRIATKFQSLGVTHILIGPGFYETYPEANKELWDNPNYFTKILETPLNPTEKEVLYSINPIAKTYP